jgi:hypothetical protein
LFADKFYFQVNNFITTHFCSNLNYQTNKNIYLFYLLKHKSSNIARIFNFRTKRPKSRTSVVRITTLLSILKIEKKKLDFKGYFKFYKILLNKNLFNRFKTFKCDRDKLVTKNSIKSNKHKKLKRKINIRKNNDKHCNHINIYLKKMSSRINQ